jgi:hypothetical protein
MADPSGNSIRAYANNAMDGMKRVNMVSPLGFRLCPKLPQQVSLRIGTTELALWE